MREIVGDTVLTAPMLQWGPMFSLFVEELLAGTWTAEQQPWLGLDAQAVDLAPYFSPKVAPATVELVLATARAALGASPAAELAAIADSRDELFTAIGKLLDRMYEEVKDRG